MIVQFEKVFLSKLVNPGYNLDISHFRVVESKGQINRDVSEKSFTPPAEFEYRGELMKLASIWNYETLTLDMTVDLSSEEYQKIYGVGGAEGPTTSTSYSIVVYYSELGHSTDFRPAFKIIPEVSGKYTRLGLLLDGKNHYSIEFPPKTVANITVHSLDQEVEFLESTNYVGGHNIYNDGISEHGPVTRDSGLMYLREMASADSDEATYISKQGKKISESTRYIKVYKSISIKAANLEGHPDKFGNYSYFLVGAKNTIKIVGTVTYDYYEVSEGNHYLLETDLTEDLTEDIRLNISYGGDFHNFVINQKDRTISYNLDSDLSEISDTYVYAVKRYFDELGDGHFKEVTTRNTIRLVKYAGWRTFANTPFTEEDTANKTTHPLFVLGHESGSIGTYELSVSKKADLSKISLKIHDNRAEEFFQKFEYRLVYDKEVKGGFRYLVTITTKSSNLTTDTIPEGANPILCSVNLGSTTIPFFVIQRYNPEKNKLILKTLEFQTLSPARLYMDVNEGPGYEGVPLPIENKVGVKFNRFFVSSSINIPHYNTWEWGSESQLLSGVYKGSGAKKDIVFEYDPTKEDLLASITTNRPITPNKKYDNGRNYLGHVILVRRPDDHKYSDTNWRDSIYCSGSEVKGLVFLQFNLDEYKNNPVFLSETPFSYQDKKLFLFSGGKNKNAGGEFTEVDNPQYLISKSAFEHSAFGGSPNSIYNLEVSSSEKQLVTVNTTKENFEEDISSTIVGWKVREVFKSALTPKQINKTTSWWGSLDTGNSKNLQPITVKLNNSNKGVVVGEETIYCIEGGQYQKLRLFTDNEISASKLSNPTTEQIGSSIKLTSEVYKLALSKGYLPSGAVIEVAGTYWLIKAKNYREIITTEYLNDGELSLANFEFRRNIYIAGEAYEDFKYWAITSDTIDVDISNRIGELCRVPSKSGGSYMFQEGDIKSTLVISVNGNRAGTISPLEINRVNNASTLGSLSTDIRFSWMYEMYRDKGNNSANLTVSLKEADTGAIKLSTDFEDKATEFPVNYIGLYKLNIQSENKCNVMLSSTKHIRFFDEDTDKLQPDTVKIKEVAGSSFVVPIYIAFIGDSSYEDRDLPDTVITISQVEGGTERRNLKVHRYLTELSKSSGGKLQLGQAISSDLTKIPGGSGLDQLVVRDKSDIFINVTDGGGSGTYDIRVKSKLEVFTKNIQYINSNFGDAKVKYSNHFFSIGTIDKDRGYLYSDLGINTYTKVNHELPYKVMITFDLLNNSGSSIKFRVYSINREGEMGYSLTDHTSTIRLPNKNVDKKIYLVSTAKYLLPYLNWFTYSHSQVPGLTIDTGHGNSGNGSHVAVIYITYKDNPERDYRYVSTIKINGVFRNNVSRYIKDEQDKYRTDYTPSDFLPIFGETSISIPIYQDGTVKGSPTVQSMDWSNVNPNGELRSFSFNKQIRSVELDPDSSNAFETNMSGTHGSSILGSTLSLRFFSRPTRLKTVYPNEGYDYQVGDQGKSAMIDVFRLNQRPLPINFTVNMTDGTSERISEDNSSLGSLTLSDCRSGIIVGYETTLGDQEHSRLKYKLMLGPANDELSSNELSKLRNLKNLEEKELLSLVGKCRNVIKVTRQIGNTTPEKLLIATMDFPQTPTGEIDTTKPGNDKYFKYTGLSKSSIQTYTSAASLTIDGLPGDTETKKIDGFDCNYVVFPGFYGSKVPNKFIFVENGNGCSFIYWIVQK